MNIAVKAVAIMLETMLLLGSGVAQVHRIGGLVSATKVLRNFTFSCILFCLPLYLALPASHINDSILVLGELLPPVLRHLLYSLLH